MEEKKLVPKLRFPGFTEPWEQRKLADILSRRKENRRIDSAYPRLAFAAGQGVIPLSERRTNNRDQLISDEKNKKYLVTYYNDIVYNPANLKYGAIDRNKYGQGVISPIYVTFTSNICSGFVEHIVKSHAFKEKVLSFEEGTVTKRQAVNPDNLLKIDVVITSNSKEQEKISKLFELIDLFITLHQRKLEHLKLKKKSLLQKLFPKEGEVYPELRFPGFTAPWEQRKLGEMASFSKGNGYFKSDLKSTGIPIILYGRLYTKYETVIEDIDTFADAKEGAVYSLGGEVIVPASGETAEDISIASVVQNPGVLLGGDLNIIRPIENLLPAFLALSISNGSSHREMSKRAQGKSVVHLHNEDLAQIDLKYPSVEEQSKITACINWIDTLITLHQRKLEHLQLLKKALLQQLFV